MNVYYYKGNYKDIRQELLLKAWEDYRPSSPMPEISRDFRNKPYFCQDSAFLSISHSGQYFACVLWDFAVGLDIQEVNERADIIRISKRFFPTLKNVHEEKFYRNWVKREAKGKLTGEGFFIKDYEGEDVFFKEFMIDEKIYGATASKVKGELWIKELKLEKLI